MLIPAALAIALVVILSAVPADKRDNVVSRIFLIFKAERFCCATRLGATDVSFGLLMRIHNPLAIVMS